MSPNKVVRLFNIRSSYLHFKVQCNTKVSVSKKENWDKKINILTFLNVTSNCRLS